MELSDHSEVSKVLHPVNKPENIKAREENEKRKRDEEEEGIIL